MLVRRFKLGTEQNFEYLLVDESSREALVVDSGWEVDPIVTAARDENLEVKFAVATHHHSDHTATLWQLAQLLDAKVAAHPSSPITHDLPLADGEVLQLGKNKVRAFHTPGHTDDSICLFDGKNLFTGDALLIGRCGRTDFEGGSPQKMYRSLKSILKLPPGTMIYPGHDYGETPCRTLIEEKKRNPELAARSYAEFLKAHAARGH